jgi:hypothetical protein
MLEIPLTHLQSCKLLSCLALWVKPNFVVELKDSSLSLNHESFMQRFRRFIKTSTSTSKLSRRDQKSFENFSTKVKYCVKPQTRRPQKTSSDIKGCSTLDPLPPFSSLPQKTYTTKIIKANLRFIFRRWRAVILIMSSSFHFTSSLLTQV